MQCVALLFVLLQVCLCICVSYSKASTSTEPAPTRAADAHTGLTGPVRHQLNFITEQFHQFQQQQQHQQQQETSAGVFLLLSFLNVTVDKLLPRLASSSDQSVVGNSFSYGTAHSFFHSGID